MVLICKMLNPLHQKLLCAKFGWKLVQLFWWRRYLNFVNVFSLFHNYLPLEMGVAFIWTNLNHRYSNMLCPKFGWNWPSVSGEEDFKISSMYFRHFVIIYPSKWARSSFEQTWIPSPKGHPRMLLAKFVWIWPSGSEEILKISSIHCHYFVIIHSSKKMKMWKVNRHWQMDGRTNNGWSDLCFKITHT